MIAGAYSDFIKKVKNEYQGVVVMEMELFSNSNPIISNELLEKSDITFDNWVRTRGRDEYKQYIQMILTVPNDFKISNLDDIFFKIARRIAFEYMRWIANTYYYNAEGNAVGEEYMGEPYTKGELNIVDDEYVYNFLEIIKSME